jgi:hypothetical protein
VETGHPRAQEALNTSVEAAANLDDSSQRAACIARFLGSQSEHRDDQNGHLRDLEEYAVSLLLITPYALDHLGALPPELLRRLHSQGELPRQLEQL